MSFFQIFHKKPLTAMPIFGQKNVNFVKIKLYYGPEKSIRYPFFRFFTTKYLLSCPYFFKKKPFSKNHAVLMATFSQINVDSLKNTVLSCFFFIFHEKPTRLSYPYLVQKNVNSDKTTLYLDP